jgi:hypothetical protein
MRDVLPVNGASAHNIPDPQSKVAVSGAVCAHCDRLLRKWDEVKTFHASEEETLRFCDSICLGAWLDRKGPDWVIELLEREGFVETEVLGEVE